MSEPKRYDNFQYETAGGEYVLHSDYAKLRMKRIHDLNQIGGLQEENARLKQEVNALMTNPTSRLLRAKQSENAVLAIENDLLKTEVERLTKAGDELHAFLINYIVDSRISSAYLNKLDDGWTTAKEVQS